MQAATQEQSVREGLPTVGVMSVETYQAFWPQIAEQLEAIQHMWAPWYTLEFLRTCQGVDWEVWGACQGGELEVVVYTTVAIYSSCTVYRIPLAFGRNIKKYIPVLDAQFTKIAGDLGCDDLEVVGREGWGRVFGVKPVAHIFRRPVQHHRVN